MVRGDIKKQNQLPTNFENNRFQKWRTSYYTHEHGSTFVLPIDANTTIGPLFYPIGRLQSIEKLQISEGEEKKQKLLTSNCRLNIILYY